jgi:hypothetical protein
VDPIIQGRSESEQISRSRLKVNTMKGRKNVRNLELRGEARDHELIWVTSNERTLYVVVGATFKLKATERVCAHFLDHVMHSGTLSFESHITPLAIELQLTGFVASH